MPRADATSGKQADPENAKEAGVIRAYLDALHRPRKRGRKRSPDRIRTQLETISARIAQARDPLVALDLRQERLRLQEDLAQLEAAAKVTPELLEEQFVAVAREYSRHKGITHAAWRDAGVPRAILHRAGIFR